jgi:hypothetical protein
MQPPGRQTRRVFGKVRDDKHIETSITDELKPLVGEGICIVLTGWMRQGFLKKTAISELVPKKALQT